jgi:hypothetical protein
LSSDEFTQSKIEGYSYKETESNYAQIKQRWIIDLIFLSQWDKLYQQEQQ